MSPSASLPADSSQPDTTQSDTDRALALARAREVLQSSASKLALPRSQWLAGTGAQEGQAPSRNVSDAPEVLALQHPQLSQLLPDGGFPLGQVSELCVAHPSYATSLSLLACARAQQHAVRALGQPAWCAFVDPFASLYAPGAVQAGVDLQHLLVVRPSASDLVRISVRLVEARAFSLVVIDTHDVTRQLGTAPDLGKWVNAVRRLNLALMGSHSLVLLITDKNAARPMPLPVSLRLELSCVERGRLSARVAKERHGRLSALRNVTCRDFMPGLTESGSVEPGLLEQQQ